MTGRRSEGAWPRSASAACETEIAIFAIDRVRGCAPGTSRVAARRSEPRMLSVAARASPHGSPAARTVAPSAAGRTGRVSEGQSRAQAGEVEDALGAGGPSDQREAPSVCTRGRVRLEHQAHALRVEERHLAQVEHHASETRYLQRFDARPDVADGGDIDLSASSVTASLT